MTSGTSGTWMVCAAAACACAAVALALRSPPMLSLRGRPPTAVDAGVRGDPAAPGLMRRWRWLLVLSAGVGALTFLGGALGALTAPAVAVATWVAIGRIEPAGVRRAREEAAKELPHVVRLLGLALAAGVPPAEALDIVAEALPGPVADRLRPVALRLRLGADPLAGWAALGADPALAPLGRALGRAEDGGVSVAAAIARLADDLARQAHAAVEGRARAVGVKAAAPLGLCLLPAFLLIGIVPLVGGLLTSLRW